MKSRKNFFPNGFDIDMTPFQEFVNRMDSLFNESFQHLNSRFNLKSFAIKTSETESDIIVQAELPGYTRDQIKLEMVGHQLRILAEQNAIYDERDDQLNRHKHVQSMQTLERVVTLPYAISKKDVKASLENGILKIIIPKREIDPQIIDITDQ